MLKGLGPQQLILGEGYEKVGNGGLWTRLELIFPSRWAPVEVQLSAVAASCVVTLKRVGGEIRSSRSEIGKSEEECFGQLKM